MTTYYQPLFNYLSNQHGVHLLESDMCEIINIVKQMKNKERIAMLESEISRLKVVNRNTNERLEVLISHLAEQHKGANFSKLNPSEIPNTCEPFSALPDALQELCNFVAMVEQRKVKPEAPECVANNIAPNEGHLREHIDNFFNPKADNAIKSFEAKIMQEFGEAQSGEAKQVNREDIYAEMFKIMRNTYDVHNLKASITPDFIPDWKDAPEDAVCVAMDEDGNWWWYDRVPRESISAFAGGIARACFATNAHLLPPDYWKSTLMMRPEAVSELNKALHNVLVNHAPNTRSFAPNYSHLIPEGYEFCQEADAVKWVKVDDIGSEFKIGCVKDVFYGYVGTWLPIRPIQYKITTHEIVTAVPDPYMPDWSKAPEGTVAHAWDMDGFGYWYTRIVINTRWEGRHISSHHTLPPDLDWKQSLRVKPN